jgi:hypothetical protein
MDAARCRSIDGESDERDEKGGVSAPGSGACCTSIRTPRAARFVMNVDSPRRKLGGGTVVAVDPLASVSAMAPSAKRTCFTCPRSTCCRNSEKAISGGTVWRRLA